METRQVQRILLGIIITVYLLVAGLFAVRTPAWQTPDEPAHYNYIAQIATQGKIPVIRPGDWDQDYLSALTSARFAPHLLDELDSIQYEDHQPPLYYLLAAPVYIATDGSLTALRLFSVLIGTAIVVCAYGVGLVLFPDRPWVGLGAAGLVALLPGHVMFLASVNNDALGWALVGGILLATVIYLKQGHPVQAWQLGLLVGLGLLTKTTTYLMAGIVPLALVLRWWTLHQNAVRLEEDFTFPEEARHDALRPPYLLLLKELGLFLLPALLLGGMWWLRNISVYGFPDFLGLAAHDSVVVGQLRTADHIASVGAGAYLREALRTTYNSFWGQFGWMAVPMQPRFYTMITLGLGVCLSGIAADMILYRRPRSIKTEPEQRNAWIILACTAALSILAYVYYNTEFVQFQGRYMYPLLIPLALWLALGLDGWRRLLFTQMDIHPDYGLTQNLPWLVSVAFLPLAIFDLWLLWNVIVPNLQF